MIKKFLVVASFFTPLIHSMESDKAISLIEMKKHYLQLKHNKTYINLTKGPLSDVTERDNQTIIVGANQQGWSSGTFTTNTTKCFPENKVGTMRKQYLYDYYYRNEQNWPIYPDTHYVYENDDSASDDDTYKPYTRSPLNRSCKDAYKHPSNTPIKMQRRTVSSHVVMITEPCIKQAILKKDSDEDDRDENNNKLSYIYDSCRYNESYGYDSDDWDQTIQETFTGNKAIQEASKDLKLCYKTILSSEPERPFAMNDSVCFRYSHKDEKAGTKQTNTINIVIPPLSTDVGFPRDIAASIAVAAILKNLKKYPDTFNNISLFVQKRSDFTLYKKLLMKHAEPIKDYSVITF
jgi:hypothetical protein